jgi:hypothetical protein
VLEEIAELENKVGLPQNFFHNLTGEDDWSFVIKLNALFEAASTHLLVSKLNVPELENNFTYLDFGNQKFGKVALLKKLECISKDEAKFLQVIFELRNMLAHNIKNVNFQFSEYIESLDKNQKKSFVKAIKCGRETIQWNCTEQPREKYILSHPKILIIIVASDILVSMQLQQSG